MMNKTVFVLLTVIASFAVGGFIAVIRFLLERNRKHNLTGGSFRESFKDNSDSADFFLDESKGGDD